MVSKYAQVSNGKVQNLAIFATREDAIRISKAIYGEDADAVNIDYIDVRFGANYHDNWFYNVDEDGMETPAENIPTEKQEIASLKSLNESLTLALADIIGG